MVVISVCLSDLPKDKITEGKNGKKYINLVVDEKKEIDQYKNSHIVYVNQTKEEREAKIGKKYVGNGREYKFNATTPQTLSTEQYTPPSSTSVDDLPF